MFKHRKYKMPRGQSTVEYILVVTAVIGVVIAMTASFKAKLGNSMDQSQTSVVDMGDRLAASRGVSQFDPTGTDLNNPSSISKLPAGAMVVYSNGELSPIGEAVNNGGSPVNGGWCVGQTADGGQVCACPPPKNGGTCSAS